MKTLKIIIDIEGNNVRTEGFEKDGNITLEEAGLSHTDLTDKEEITEYFEERYSEDEVTVEFEQHVKPKLIMNYSAEQIANYINENINLTPNSNWTIYESTNGLTHTKGSMEYRDDEHQEVMSFITMDEAPEDMEALINSVEFQMNK